MVAWGYPMKTRALHATLKMNTNICWVRYIMIMKIGSFITSQILLQIKFNGKRMKLNFVNILMVQLMSISFLPTLHLMHYYEVLEE